MDNLTDEEKHRIEVYKMFNIAEKPVMEYICSMLSKSPDRVFTDSLPTSSEALILQPLKSYSDKYLSFSLEMMPADFCSQMPDVLRGDENIRNSLGFLNYALRQVWSAVITNGLHNSAAEEVAHKSIHLELDLNTLSFVPIYVYPLRRRELMALQVRDDLENLRRPVQCESAPAWDEFSDDQKEAWEKQYRVVEDLINHSSYDEELANDKEAEMRTVLTNCNKIGIVYRELTRSELPHEVQESLTELELSM